MKKKHLEKGLFITFEGIEGAGKTTQLQLLFQRLKLLGYDVIRTREPGGSRIGEEIRHILFSKENLDMKAVTELFLFAAARFQHVQELILPSLAEGRIVLCDRFFDATTAYQGYGRGIDKTIIEKINNIANNGLIPHLTFLLDIDPEKGLKRVHKRVFTRAEENRLDAETVEFYEKVREGYLELAQRHSCRFVVLSGEGRKKEIHEAILKEALEILKIKLRKE